MAFISRLCSDNVQTLTIGLNAHKIICKTVA